MAQRAPVFVAIDILNDSIDKLPIENTHFRRLWRIPHSLPLTSSCLELPLVYFLLEDLPAMEVLESKPELSDVLGRVGDEHSITVQQIVFPFPDVLDSVTIFLFHCFQVAVLSLELAWYFFELVVEEGEVVVELQVQFLQPVLHLAHRLLLCRLFNLHRFLQWIITSDNSGMKQLMVNHS